MIVQWFTENLGTILISLGLLLLVAAAVSVLWWDKKRGRKSCGGNCGACQGCNGAKSPGK